jgi:uncharacterized glyoxalase superfamily protein PhnB
MPPGIIIPELAYPDVRAAVTWLCRAFGFVERLRIGNHRAQLALGEGAIVVTEQRVIQGAAGGDAFGTRRLPVGQTVMVRVADVDRHHAQAKQAGARIVNPPTDYAYGERQYTADDIGGHRWTFSQTLADVDPATWGGELLGP